MSQTLEAGRELDALIAEKVMGWTRVARINAPNRMWPPISSRVWLRPNSPHPVALPKFSTDIAAAWLVVEKLRESFSRVEVHSVTVDGGTGYVCLLEEHSGAVDERYVAAGEAETAPLAICRAALATLDGTA